MLKQDTSTSAKSPLPAACLAPSGVQRTRLHWPKQRRAPAYHGLCQGAFKPWQLRESTSGSDVSAGALCHRICAAGIACQPARQSRATGGARQTVDLRANSCLAPLRGSADPVNCACVVTCPTMHGPDRKQPDVASQRRCSTAHAGRGCSAAGLHLLTCPAAARSCKVTQSNGS